MANPGGVFGGVTSSVFSLNFSPQNNLNIPVSTPPLSAIDRFLASDFENLNTSTNRVSGNNNNNMLIFDPNYVGVPYDKFNFFYKKPQPQPEGTYNFFMTESQIQNWERSVAIRDEELLRRATEQAERQKRKRVRGRARGSKIIKGQWTPEEDRKVQCLVRRYGEKKWAQISDEMLGRSGKQCRERWQNHLRPEIKKDSWNEEEEKMLIEAHRKLGNKWAEIAKRIPGRTENSIKNHWNATKRRQFTKRKFKKHYAASKNSILHDYIKAKLLKAAANQTSPNSTSTEPNPNLPIPSNNLEIPTFPQSASQDSTLIEPNYDEDMNDFMQTFFGSNDNDHNNSPNLVDDINKLLNDDNLQSSDSIQHGTMMITANQENVQVHGNFPNEGVAQVQPMDASRVSDLLDGFYSTPFLDYCYNGTPCLDKVQHQQQQQQQERFMVHQAQGASSTSGTKEMDLFEMLLANFQ